MLVRIVPEGKNAASDFESYLSYRIDSQRLNQSLSLLWHLPLRLYIAGHKNLYHMPISKFHYVMHDVRLQYFSVSAPR